MIDRRAFLRRLGFGTVSAAAAALTFDVDRLLWVPGAKTIVVLPPHEPYLNAFFTAEWVVKDQLQLLEQQLTLVQYVNREYLNTQVDTVALRIAGRA